MVARLRFPRVRGDVPYRAVDNSKAALFSPHTRGCSFPIYTL